MKSSTKFAQVINQFHRHRFTDLFTEYEGYFSYYRFFYFFSLLILYTNIDRSIIDKKYIQECFNIFIDQQIDTSNKLEKVKKKIDEHFDHLYETFFKNKNVYYSTYFNNLIKYFQPLPFDLYTYCPVATFRNNLDDDQFYKKNNIDYLNIKGIYETVKRQSIVTPRNIDQIKNEIDIHIPIKYFDPLKFNNNTIYLIARSFKDGHHLYITNKLITESEDWLIIPDGKQNLMYMRHFKSYKLSQYKKGLSMQCLSKPWLKNQVHGKIKFHRNVVSYLSAYQKINKNDLFNVFNEIKFDRTNYKQLFHNTGLDTNINSLKNYLQHPTFFSFYPNYWVPYFKGRKCIKYSIEKDISGILDLTNNITVTNPFRPYIKSKLKKDKNDKQWAFYDFNKIDEQFYNPTKFPDMSSIPKDNYHPNNKCIKPERGKTLSYVQDRPYCDTNHKSFYVGRRKLQEILFKTRKYEPSEIWIWESHYKKYKECGIDINKIKCMIGKLDCKNYDVIILNKLDVNGFFSTDYNMAIESGGEVMLTKPDKFIEPRYVSSNTCTRRDAQFRKL